MTPEALSRHILTLVARARAIVADHPAAAAMLAHRGPRAERTTEQELIRIGEAVRVARHPDATACWREATTGWWTMATCPAARRIAAQEARRHVGILDLEDLEQEALVGCYCAARRFDPSRGVSFATHARWWARARIRRAIETDGRPVRLPGQAAQTAALARAIVRQAETTGRTLTHAEVAAQVGQTTGVLHQMLAASSVLVSLDAPVFHDEDENGARLGDLLLAMETDPTDALAASRVGAAIDALGERERALMVRRIDGATLREIGADLGVSRERVRQIEMRAIGELRARLDVLLPEEPEVTRRPSKRQQRKRRALAAGRMVAA